MRVYRDRREDSPRDGKRKKTRSTRPTSAPVARTAPVETSAGVKVLTLDGAPVLHIGETDLYDETKISEAEEVSPESFSTIDRREFEMARAVGPDGRTAFKDWEKHLDEEAKREAALGVLMEVDGKTVQRRWEDFMPRCTDCDSTHKCFRCKGSGKRLWVFRCKVCAGSGRCLQCLPISERPCPVCGEFIRMQESACPSCGREFQCPRCKRHLPFEATRCPTCETIYKCASCGAPVAITHQKCCDKCGGVKVSSGRVRVDI